MIRIHFQKDWGRNGYAFYLFDENSQGEVTPYKATLERGEPITSHHKFPPALVWNIRESEDIFRALATALQEINFLPKDTATQAELRATERHLTDMRTLVFEPQRPAENVEVRHDR